MTFFFFLNLDQRVAVAPLFEAQLDLKVPDMVFTPPLEFGAGDSFFELVESLINDVFRISSLVPRLAQHSPFPHYQVLAGDAALIFLPFLLFFSSLSQCLKCT